LVLSVLEGKRYTTHPIYSYFLHVTFLLGFPIKILYACYSELYNAKIKSMYLDKDKGKKVKESRNSPVWPRGFQEV